MGFENGKLLRVVLKADNLNGQTQVNTLHYDLIDDPLVVGEENDPQALADAFRDDVMPTFGACFSNAWSITPVVIVQEKDPLNPLAPRSEWTSGVAFSGTRSVSSDLMPPETCGVATLVTANIGRRARGRMFLGGTLVEGDQAGGTYNVFPLTLWQALLDAIPRQPDISPPGSTATANWAVYSRTQRQANANPYAPHVTSAILRSRVHFLRSRGR